MCGANINRGVLRFKWDTILTEKDKTFVANISIHTTPFDPDRTFPK